MLVLDTDSITVGVIEDDRHLWTAESEARSLSECGVGWDTGIVSHDELLIAFYERHGSRQLAGPDAIELEAIEALGAEEHARGVWEGIV